MPRILSLSLRPRTLSGLFGQEKLVAGIRKQMAVRPPATWLFTGGTGTGKTTIARIIAVAFQCSHMKLWGDPCEACWKVRGDFAIHEINASDISGVEEIGKVAEMSRIRPMGCLKRVIILDEFQKVTSTAQNLLLKPFEEPPATTVWIVCTTDPNKILPTLRRRAAPATYQLKSLGINESEKFLTKAAAFIKFTASLEPLFEQVHLAQIGSPALLLGVLEKFSAGASAEEACAGTDGTTVDSLRICKAVTSGDWNSLKKYLQNVSPEESRFIRASVAGWMRGCLLRATGSDLTKAVDTLTELTAPAPIEDSLLLLWLWPVLYRAVKRYSK